MSDFDLNKITQEELIKNPLKDLLAFQEILNKAVETRRENEKREIYEKIQSLASESGFSLSELLPNMPSEKNIKKATAKIKYRNPNNKDEGWTGKGRKPAWLVALLDAGKKLEDFAV
jgi:DNA-binding protein H-NS